MMKIKFETGLLSIGTHLLKITLMEFDEIPDGQDAIYRNSFGLIHPIGNVHTRSIEGTLRGGAFEFPSWSAESSDRLQSLRGYGSFRRDDVGSRLYEEIR